MAEPWEEDHSHGVPGPPTPDSLHSSLGTGSDFLEELRGRSLARIAMKCHAAAGPCKHHHMDDDQSFCPRKGSLSPARYICCGCDGTAYTASNDDAHSHIDNSGGEYAESNSSRASSEERNIDQLRTVYEAIADFEAMKDNLLAANIDQNSIPSLDKDELRLDPEMNIKTLLNNPDAGVREKHDELFSQVSLDVDASDRSSISDVSIKTLGFVAPWQGGQYFTCAKCALSILAVVVAVGMIKYGFDVGHDEISPDHS